MKKIIELASREETIKIGKQLGEHLKPHMLIVLDGDLGAGKTTLTQGIGQGLGITRIINSPTFTILKQYQGRLQLSHFDAYRLEGQDTELGFEEIFQSDDVCVVEWAQYISHLLPQERLHITIKRIDDNSREMIFHPIGEQYKQLVEEVFA